jgi:nucleoid-associated protein YgaU
MALAGGLQHLTIEAYAKSNFSGLLGEFQVLMNPEKYARDYKILYNDVQPQGKSSGSPEYNKTKSDQVSFELIFDATGAVPPVDPGKPVSAKNGIEDQIDAFLKLVFDYNGNTHSPNFLRLLWGRFSFDCRLTKLKFDYTLFRPDGVALRAKAAVTFEEYTNKVELAKEENNNSPDLTHVRTVNAGSTLPNMCYEIYGSSALYLQVAAVNGLTDFRALTVGSELVFPPLAEDS